MGSIYNRGTRDRPRWYVTFKDAAGRRQAINSRQPTKVQARKFLERIEARIADGMVGIERPDDVPFCKGLLEAWAKSLTNRNARQDDRGERGANGMNPDRPRRAFSRSGIEVSTAAARSDLFPRARGPYSMRP